MNRVVIRFCLALSVLVTGWSYGFANASPIGSVSINAHAKASLIGSAVQHSVTRIGARVTLEDDCEMVLEEKEKEENEGQSKKENEIHVVGCPGAIQVVIHQASIKLSDKLYLLQGVLRI